jgi:hypothetical protein
MGYELDRARLETSRNESEDAYFKARPQIDSSDRRKVFDAGYVRGWEDRKEYEQEKNVSPNARDNPPTGTGGRG